MEYKYTVNYAHVNDDAEDIEGGVHHGTGSMEITTDTEVVTQEHKNEVARIVGRALHEKHNVTALAIQSIVPVKNEEND